MRAQLVVLSVLVVVAGLACSGPARDEPAPSVVEVTPPPPLVASSVGEIGHDAFVLWARAEAPASAHVRVQDGERARDLSFALEAEHDHAGTLRIEGLRSPRVRWSLRLSAPGASAPPSEPAASGEVRLAPPSTERAAVSFAWTGDVGGQNVCRDREHGFPLLGDIDASRFDFTVSLGDWIYADNTCEARGRFGNPQVPGDFTASLDLDQFRRHWRYAEGDAGYRAFRARTYVDWDDHEIMNDFGRGHPLLAVGRRAFLEHAPLEDGRFYRDVRWGAHLHLVILDTRSYRDANDRADDGAEPKTLLGAEQRAWLEAILRRSDATWIVVASSVPLAIPTGFPIEHGRDGWADGGNGQGFERELVGLLRIARDAHRRLVFVTTDVHFASAFRYVPFEDTPGFVVHELVVGPASAGLFPTRALDETLRPERLFFHGPEDADAITTLAQARPYFTWGTLSVAADGGLRAEIRDAERALYTLALPAE